MNVEIHNWKHQFTILFREVEKKLRNIGIPMDHCLLEIPDIWAHLLKTFKWKQKFANKGILNEQWPFYDAMANYMELEQEKFRDSDKGKIMIENEDAALDDDYEDDMKLLDLKQMLHVKPKYECEGNQCRSCSSEHGCVDVFQEKDDEGVDLAQKLKLIGGVEVSQTDRLPSQICLNCVKELESAYKFRRKCQEVDRQLRSSFTADGIKIELRAEENEDVVDDMHEDGDRDEIPNSHPSLIELHHECPVEIEKKTNVLVKNEKQNVRRKRRKSRKLKYDYWKICEVCGKHTRNLLSHLDAHSKGKTYSCDMCDKKFKFKSGLVIHKAVHNPTPKKTCEVCGKTFHILAQYRRHFVYHANERKYGCETCGKRFNTLDILRVHNRTHTDERPFTCQECGKTFRTAGCVSRHKRIVHRGVKAE